MFFPLAPRQTPPAPVSLNGSPEQAFLSSYKKIPPINGATNVPGIGSVTGLGTGGGAGLQFKTNNGLVGEVHLFAGSGVSSSWSFTLTYPNTPPTLAIFSDQSLGTVTQATVNDVVTISGTGASMNQNSKPYRLSFEPITSD